MADLWLRVDERHKAGKPIAKLLARIEYRLRLTRRWPKVDCLEMVPGIALSARAREAFEDLGVAGMQFLEFCVNGEPFFLFYTERVVDCLDRTASEVRFFRSVPGHVSKVLRYMFVEDRLKVCDVFAIPEQSDGMFFWAQATFFTELARIAIEREGLIGIRFEELPGQTGNASAVLE